jgi:hypothetical protein
MITYAKKVQSQDAFQFEFNGLSGDTKPTVTFEGAKIANGSTFMEMDTKTLYFYDAENNAWV